MAEKGAKSLNRLLSSKKTILLILVMLVVVYGYLGVAFYETWLDNQVVFHDVTVELGTEALGIRDFMTERASAKRASFVSDPSVIDLSQVGQTKLILRHGSKDHTVTLTVQDTTAPAAKIETERTVSIHEPLPAAKDLVSEVQDMSKVEIYYIQEPVIPEDYSSVTQTIVLEDACGNKLEQTCQFHYSGWLQESCTMELGGTLTAEMLLSAPEKDGTYLDQTRMEEISKSGVGEHVITVSTGGAEASCTVTIQDTTAPVLKLQNVRRHPGESAQVSDFVSLASDLSGEPQVRMVGEAPDYSVQGKYTIVIEAEDLHGNVTKSEATLWVSSNLNPPVIKGAGEAISMEKYTTPDFLAGVTATDDLDGACTVTVDASALDNTKAGTYYITYSSIDNSGNEGTYKRKVVVEPNEEDTAALVNEIAASLPRDPEAIRDYVHDTIAYSSNWGGDDPIWHGLTQKTGNCFVHANTLKALLEYHGYETQLIWVWNESHYWLIIKLDEGWRHIDSTPSSQHEKVGLGTDRVRYLNLNGRDWDRSKWPACE